MHWWTHVFTEGDLLVHFPGTGGGRADYMNKYMDLYEKNASKHKIDLDLTTYPAQIEAFRANDTATEKQRQKTYWEKSLKVEQIEAERYGVAEEAKAKAEAEAEA